MNKKILLITFTLVFTVHLDARVKRISDKEMDLSKPHIIYMTPGRSTLLDFPCEISFSPLGINDDIKITIGPDSKKTMILWLAKETSQPTNLIVKCDGEIYVFDIYPNRRNHQDYLNIVESFDSRQKSKMKLIDSSSSKAIRGNAKLRLINSSEIQQESVSSSEILKRLNRNSKSPKLISKGVTK